MPGMTRARPGAVAGPRARCSRCDTRRGAGRRGADERDRVPHLELDREAASTSPTGSIFDLDPGEGVELGAGAGSGGADARAARRSCGLQSWLKTSGGKGLHVVVPLAPRLDYDVVKAFSQAVVQHLAQDDPGALRRQERRRRTGSARSSSTTCATATAQTTAAAFSARARPGLGVSMPVAWEQLTALKSGAQWTIATAREYLSFQKDDPWADYWTIAADAGRGHEDPRLQAVGVAATARR